MMLTPTADNATIVAPATPRGPGAVAIIRVSGRDAFAIVSRVWHGRSIDSLKSHTLHLGEVRDPVTAETLDQSLLAIFRAPNSFTGEDSIEINCHASAYIQEAIIRALISAGARTAMPGEFSQRAFLNGRLDLAQAEAVADLIAANSKGAHALALQQLKGAYSRHLDQLRERIVHFASMLELELDFAEEDVNFADRDQLLALAHETHDHTARLARSFATGNAIKNGIPVAIVGAPNVGKSTLLNALLEEERAIVSQIPGTTRDSIEATLEIEGLQFRLIDTAGLRATTDQIEALGIERTHAHMNAAKIILYLAEKQDAAAVKRLAGEHPEATIIPVLTKLDLRRSAPAATTSSVLAKTAGVDNPFGVDACADMGKLADEDNTADTEPVVSISAKTGEGLDDSSAVSISAKTGEGLDDSSAVSISAKTGEGLDTLKRAMYLAIRPYGDEPQSEIIVTNLRHYEALCRAKEALQRVITGLEQDQYTDLIAQDLREATHHIGAITGAITTDTLLHTIFSRFCIGK